MRAKATEDDQNHIGFRSRREVRKMANELVLLKLILVEIPALIFILDAEGYITFANKTAIEFSGYALEPTQRLNIRELLDRSSFKMLVTERGSLDQGQNPQLKRYHLITKQGTIIDLEAKAVRIDRQGEEPIFLGVAFDIRDRLQVEAERALLQEEIVKLQGMDIIAHLVSGLIHDSNNVLTGVMGKLLLLLNKPIAELKQKPENSMDLILEAEDILRQIQELLDEISDMNRRFLNFARQEESIKELVDIRAVVASSIDLCLDAMRRKKINQNFNFEKELPWLMVNSAEIKRVIINILLNAIDAISNEAKKREIDINLRQVDLTADKIPQCSRLEPQKYIIIEISDKGIGMDDATRSRIFEPFFTTKRMGKGTGLGLSISASIMKKYNGWIDCQSKVGEGSTFTIYLPVSSAKT